MIIKGIIDWAMGHPNGTQLDGGGYGTTDFQTALDALKAGNRPYRISWAKDARLDLIDGVIYISRLHVNSQAWSPDQSDLLAVDWQVELTPLPKRRP